MGESGLHVTGLRARYGRGEDVLHGVDLHAPRGACTALLGPNGSGKSTLLKAILGLVPSLGEIRLDGAEFASVSPSERARRVAYVPQRSLLTAQLPVRSVVDLGRFAHRGALGGAGAEDGSVVDAALEECRVAHLAERAFTALSGGEQQRVLLARALATG
ncbi:MAG: ABC transporter ATP-binding protein, partial [Planctomycetota bacterium]